MTSPRRTLEVRGVERIPLEERSGSVRSHAWLWAAANLNPFIIAYGFFVMAFGLSWPWAVVVVVTGSAVGYGLLGFVAAAGPSGGQPTMALSQRIFGRAGNSIPGAASYLALVGWSAMNLVLAVLAAVALFGRVGPDAGGRVRLVCFVVVAVVVLAVAFFGYRLIMGVQRWMALAALATVMGYVALTAHLVRLPGHPAAPSLTAFAGGLVFTLVAGGLAWVMVGADYSRYLPDSTKALSVAGWTVVGGGLAATLLILDGVLLCASRPELAAGAAQNPVGMLAGLVPPWFSVVLLVVTTIGFTSNAAMNLYSSGLNLLALGVPLGRPVTAVVNGALVLAAAEYVVFVSPGFSATFESFLDVLGVPIAAWCAVFLANSARTGDLSANVGQGRSVANTLFFGLASFVGFGLITSRDPVLRPVFGYLLTGHVRQSAWGAANLGVLVAFALAWGLSRVLSLRSTRTSGR